MPLLYVLMLVVNIMRLLIKIKLFGIILIRLKKSIYQRKYHIIQVVTDIAKKITYKLHQTNNNIVFMLIDEINHILSLINENQNRKRIVFMKYVL